MWDQRKVEANDECIKELQRNAQLTNWATPVFFHLKSNNNNDDDDDDDDDGDDDGTSSNKNKSVRQ